MPKPDKDGLVEYQAGLSDKKNAARVELLRYEIDALKDGQIYIALPETLKDSAGTQYTIDSFGGPIGPNALLQPFGLVIQICEGLPEEPISLTVDAGSLPLDTSYWEDVQVCFLADGTSVEIPLETVIFQSAVPLAYKLYLKEEGDDGSISDAADSDKWYETPKEEYAGGEKVTLKLKCSDGDSKRSLAVSHEPVTVTDYGDYLQYEFIMPYHSVRVTIMQGQE